MTPYISRKRVIFAVLVIGAIIVAVIYVFVLKRLLGFAEAERYFYAYIPLFFIVMLGGISLDIFEKFDRGWSGENKVEALLKKYGYEYMRNVQSSFGQFDYDFIFVDEGITYLVEVKNYNQLNEKMLRKFIYFALHSVEKLKDEEFVTTSVVKPLIVSVSALPEGYKHPLVMSLSDFENFLRRVKD